MGKTLVWIGILVVVAGVGVAVYTGMRRSWPEAVQPAAAELKELTAIVVGHAVSDPRSLTREQLDEMLYVSAGQGSPAMVAWLLLHGANPRANQKDRGAGYPDRSALREAARRRHCENEALLIKRVGDIARSTTPGKKDEREALVAEQVATFVNESDSHWLTALHDAVQGGKQECVAALLGAGARANAQDENGVTPLALAQEKQQALVPMLEAAVEKQEAAGAATTANATTPDATATAGVDKSRESSVANPTAIVPPAATGARPPWQTLGAIDGLYRVDLDRSGSMPQGEGRIRIVVERDGHIGGSYITFEYDCAGRTMRNLTTGEWADDHMVNQKSATDPDEKKWGRGPPNRQDPTQQVVLNTLCGVTIDTGRAVATNVGWKTLGTFEHNELQILPSTRTANRAQYRLGTSPSSGFTGLGWLSELDCEKYSMRNLRNQVWKDGAIIRDEVALANTWNSTLRSELASAIYGGVCPNR